MVTLRPTKGNLSTARLVGYLEALRRAAVEWMESLVTADIKLQELWLDSQLAAGGDLNLGEGFSEWTVSADGDKRLKNVLEQKNYRIE